jgi:hypothetical protein
LKDFSVKNGGNTWDFERVSGPLFYKEKLKFEFLTVEKNGGTTWFLTFKIFRG